MRSLLPCCKDLFAFRQRSAPKLIFRSANWNICATLQEVKKRHAEYATTMTTLTLFQPNVLLSLTSRGTCGRIQTVSDVNRYHGLSKPPFYITILILLFHSVQGVKYSDRACCEIGSNTPSEMCSTPDEMIDTIDTMRIGIFVGVAIVVLFVICCCGWVSYKCYKQVVPQPRTNATNTITLVSAPPVPAPPAPAASFPTNNALPVGSVMPASYAIPTNNAQVTYGYGGVNAIAMTSPSASAPPMNPAYHVRR